MAGPLIALALVDKADTPEQVARLVAPFLVESGSPVAAMAYSEHGGSANYEDAPPAEGTRTRAVRDGDSRVLNGEKMWASHLGSWNDHGPDLLTVVSRTPGGISLLAVEREHLTTGCRETRLLPAQPGVAGVPGLDLGLHPGGLAPVAHGRPRDGPLCGCVQPPRSLVEGCCQAGLRVRWIEQVAPCVARRRPASGSCRWVGSCRPLPGLFRVQTSPVSSVA